MKKMIYMLSFWGAVLLFTGPVPVCGMDVNQVTDSLTRLLNDASVPNSRKINILLSLNDLTETEHADEKLKYSRRLFEYAREENDPFSLTIALSSITIRNVRSNRVERFDSLLTYYLPAARPILQGTSSEGMDIVLEALIDNGRLFLHSGLDQRLWACGQVRRKYERLKESRNLYTRAVASYMTGRTLSVEKILKKEEGAYAGQTSLIEQSLILADSFPVNTRRMFYSMVFSSMTYAYIQTHCEKNIVQLCDKYIQVLDDYFMQEDMKRRPFIYTENLYIRAYETQIAALYSIDEKAASRLYESYKHSILSRPGRNGIRSKAFFYGMSCKVMENRNNKEALASCDSLISMIEKKEAGFYKEVVPSYVSRARILSKMGRYEDSYDAYLKAKEVSDSMYLAEYSDRLEGMRQQSGIDRLEVEKMNTVERNAKIEYIASFIILMVIFLVVVYLLYSLYKTSAINQELLANIQAAKHSEAEKIRFMNSVSHEVRTPLNIIVGFSALMADDVPSSLEKMEYKRVMDNGRKSLNELFTNLLDTANINRMLEELPMELTDANEVCRKEMEALRYNSRKEGINYVLDLPEEVYYLNTNSRYLSVLIRELLNNANKFTERGVIELCCKQNRAGNAIEFSVTDTGCGIPENKQDVVFDHFTKLNEFTSGCGNGLYLCRLIVNKHLGKLWIDKDYTIGVKMIFSIPSPPPPRIG